MPEYLPGLIIVLPILAAALIRLPVISKSRIIVDSISVLVAASTAILAGVAYVYGSETPIVHWIGGWEPREGAVIGIALVSDATSAGFIFLTSFLTTAAFLFMFRRYKTADAYLHILTLVFLGAFSGFVQSGDLLTMFVFLELMGICSYIITAFKINDKAPLLAGFNIAVIATLGAFIFLMGATLIYGLTETPNIALAASRFAGFPSSPALAIAVSLLLTGLAIKSSLFPFHFAHADSHSTAPAPHAGLFGAILMQAGLYGIARLGGILLDSPLIDSNALEMLLIISGVVTALIAAVMSVVQNHLKRLLAFSGIAHVGIATVGIGLFNSDGFAGAGIYIAGHAAVKMSLFLMAGVLLHSFNSVHAGQLSAIGNKSIWLTAMLILGALALAGAPPSGLYAGKVLIEEGLKEAGIGWLIYVIYLAAALTGAAVIRFTILIIRHKENEENIYPIYVQEGSSETIMKGGFRYMTTIPAVLLAAGVLLPLFPQAITGFEKAAAYDFDQTRYIESIIWGESDRTIDQIPQELWKFEDLAKGLVSGLIALLAGFLLAIRRFDFSLLTDGPIWYIRKFHSGHVGDYLAWLLVGAAITAAWLILKL